MLDPIDFAQLYMAQQQKAQQAQGNAKPNETDGDTPNIILPN
jgi:preprotein translocase subunit SecB